MFVEPAVVQRKFDRELASFRALESQYRARGIWLIEVSFPSLLFAFVARNHKPRPTLAFGVCIDFSDYDVQPLSVRFVDPVTKTPLKFSEIPVVLRHRQGSDHPEQLVTAWAADDDRPFLCLQGVREYHSNPGHSGDHWLLHRGTGAGRLGHVLETLAQYGSDPIVSSHFQIQVLHAGYQYTKAS